MDCLEPLFIPQNSSPWREWQGVFLVPMYATGISFGMRINKVKVASWWHRRAWLCLDPSTVKNKTKNKSNFHLRLVLVHAMLRHVSPTLSTLVDSVFLSVFTIWPIVTFLSALDNTRRSCRSTSSKCLTKHENPFSLSAPNPIWRFEAQLSKTRG